MSQPQTRRRPAGAGRTRGRSTDGGGAMTKQKKPPHDAIEQSKHAARCALLSETNASGVIEVFGKAVYGDTSGQEAYELLQKCTHEANSAKVSERMLLSQAHALDMMFASLARRAASHIGCNMLAAMETYMRLALRAQNQSRMTLETLATIKNPPVVFAKQANIANNQQVNNGEAVPVARTPETSTRPTELLEAPHAKPEWMDARAARAATPSHSAVATVEAVKRPQNTRR